jgi:hypothetical protein
MPKKVNFGANPKSSQPAPNADDWVQQQASVDDNQVTEPMRRLTIDVPEELHRRLKITAASRNMAMADLVREWISRGLDAL